MSEDLSWETTDRRVEYTCPGFDVVAADVVLPDGTETEFHHLAEGPSVVIIPFTPDGDLVCIEEWRQAVERVNLGIPAGTVEDDDADLATTARRELAEETGYVADSMTHLVAFEPINGLADSVFHYFVARGCTPDAEQSLDANESIHVSVRAYDEVRSRLRAGELQDGRTATGLCYYELFGEAA